MDKITRELELEVESLRARLIEAEETLQAIKLGAVDALVVTGQDGPRVYTLQGADHPYRIMVEEMNEAAVTTAADGVILYSNRRLADLTGIAVEKLLGTPIQVFVASCDQETLTALLLKAPKEPAKGEVSLRAKANLDIPVILSLSPVPLGSKQGICIVVTDLTDQKARMHAEAGEARYRELARRLEASKLELQDRINDLEKFHDVVVGRELKMMELENEIKRLRGELDSFNKKVC